jgi:hypothetical protein
LFPRNHGLVNRGGTLTGYEDEHRVSRRTALAMIAAGAAAAEVLPALSTADAATSHGADRIMLIRHGEKPVGTQPPFGITVNGSVDPLSLTVVGWQRAGALAELFDPAVGAVRSGLTRPTHLFASNPNPNGSMRPLETIMPLSQRLKLTVNSQVTASEPNQIAETLAATKGSSLAAWQFQGIPAIAQHLGTVHPAPPSNWPPDRFDLVWVFTRQHGGTWKFTQVPQLLLAGDKHSVIK